MCICISFSNHILTNFCSVNAVMGFFMRFEDDSVESAKNVKQWNVKIISVRNFCCYFKKLLALSLSLSLCYPCLLKP